MKLTICRPTASRTFDANSEAEVKAMQEYYTNQRDTCFNQMMKIQYRLEDCENKLGLIKKGKINQSLINEYINR